ncbi:hypothetical protein WMY93_010088 [Mugilogobius chulae]|uniref:Uncharacterized protein n=1 Tax=Mugilogobius chulae TaxID=88201 RepID=A0AAW0PGT7_9GOBI
MVIIGKKSLDKRNGENVTSKSTSLGPIPAQTMSQGTALFSCGLMEASRWRDAALPCSPVQPKPDFGSGPQPLLQGPQHMLPQRRLHLETTEPSSTAPPTAWSHTELSSTAPHTWKQPPTPQLPTQLHTPTAWSHTEPAPQRRRANASAALCPALMIWDGPRGVHRALDSGRRSPDFSPETERRRGDNSAPALPRSKSQPCVSNEKKTGVKRRRPEESSIRPSLDLAKMTQKLRSFHSLSCPGFPSDDRFHSKHDIFNLKTLPLSKTTKTLTNFTPTKTNSGPKNPAQTLRPSRTAPT